MDAFLSVQGASAPVKKKSFFSKFTRLNMLRLARAVIPAAVLMMFFPQLAMAAQGQDLMASGNTTVKATFGKDSSVVKWVVLAEVLVGAVMGTVAKLAMRQPFVLFKGLTFQKLCLPGAFRPGDHHNKMLRPGLCVVHASPQYL
ncbi:pilin [Escherichia coli BIDMC 76]|nr:pilin [Escherichia coli BIDMC 76]